MPTVYVAQKLAKESGWKRGYNTMIRLTFRLFAEENFLGNYRGNIQVSSHVLPYDLSFLSQTMNRTQ